MVTRASHSPGARRLLVAGGGALLFVLFVLQTSCGLVAGPEDLLGDVNARLIVLDVDAQNVVAVDVADGARRSDPRGATANVQLDFVLPLGAHQGTVVVLRPDGDDDDELEPFRCAAFSFDVDDDSIDVVVLDQDELDRCDDDGNEGEGEEGEGEEGEGEEGEGEEGEGEEGEGEGEGEGEEGENECQTLVERFDDADLSDELDAQLGGEASISFSGTMTVTGDGENDTFLRYESDGSSLRASVTLIDTSSTSPAAFLSIRSGVQLAALVASNDVVEARFVDGDGVLSTISGPIALPAVLTLSFDGDEVRWEAGPLGASALLRTEAADLDDGELAAGVTREGGAATAIFDDLVIEDGCAP